MNAIADVVVVGAGVIGASIAYHLASAGARVVVQERGDLAAAGATASSAGQVRMYHPDPADADLAVRSLPTFAHWADVIGGDCGFRRTGFAYLAGPDRRADVTAVVAWLSDRGVDTQLVDPQEYAAAHPGLELAGVGVVAYEGASGYADPARTVRSLLAGAIRHGAVVRPGDAAQCLTRTAAGAVTGVRTSRADICAPMVVVAAGVRANDLLPAPAAVPMVARPVGWCIADATAVPGADRLNVVIDDTIGTYFRPGEPDQVLTRVALTELPPAAGQEAVADLARFPAAVLAAAIQLLARRLPAIATAPVLAVRAAPEAYTPDQRPAIGPVEEVPGLYLAVGFSGGGFKSAPAIGLAVAAELLLGETREELARLRPDRFARPGGAVTNPDRRNALSGGSP